MKLNLSDGQLLVEIARQSIKTYLKSRKVMEKPKEYPKIFDEKRGVFVTLNRYPDKQLRGCIGYPLAYEPLIDAVISSAISAATSDPRFIPLDFNELNNIVVELTVLSPMIPLNKNESYENQIEIGRDGLFVVCGQNSGLLLPQVPIEWQWQKKEFLQQICIKAGLNSDCYLNDGCDLYRFTGQIFEEETPNGKIIEKSF